MPTQLTVSNVALQERFGGVDRSPRARRAGLRSRALRPRRDADAVSASTEQTGCSCSAARRARTRASSSCCGPSSASATSATACCCSAPASSTSCAPRSAALERWVARAAVPALRRPPALVGGGRPGVRAAGSRPPGLPVPAPGQDHRRAGDGRAVPGEAGPAAATARRQGRATGARRRASRCTSASRRIFERLRRGNRPGPAGPQALRGRATATRPWASVVAPLFEQLLDAPPPLSPRLATLTEAARRTVRRRRASACAVRPRVPGQRTARRSRAGEHVRRRDVLEAERHRDLRAPTGHVRQVPRTLGSRAIDRPLRQARRRPSSWSTTTADRGTAADQTRLVVRQTVRRILASAGTPTGAPPHVPSRGTDDRTPRPAAACPLRRLREVSPRPRTASVSGRRSSGCTRPTTTSPLLIDALDPDIVVADVVDDHRTFAEPGSPRHDRVRAQLREVLARSDVVLANCEPVAECHEGLRARRSRRPERLGAAERHGHRTQPRELRSLDGPIIGYVGNLSQRIDIDLLEALVRRPS